MMTIWKILLGTMVLFAGAGMARAEDGTPRQTSSDFTDVSSSGTLMISNSAWTQVPTSPDIRRWGILITNISSNTANMIYQSKDDGTTPVGSVGHVLSPGQTIILSFTGYMVQWFKSLHSSAEALYYEELR